MVMVENFLKLVATSLVTLATNRHRQSGNLKVSPTNVFTNILTGVVARVVLEMLAHLKMILIKILIKIKNKDARCRCSSVNNKTGKQELRQNFEFVHL